MVDGPDIHADARASAVADDVTNDARLPVSPTIVVNPARLALVWSGFVLLVVVLGTVANVGIYHIASSPDDNLAKVLKRFDLGHEPSFPNFYSAVAILFAAALLVLIGRLEQRQKLAGAGKWYGLAAVFAGLGVDEAVVIHEMINAPIKQRFETGGLLFLPWVIVGAIFALAVAAIFMPFVYRKSKRTFWLFVVAGSIFVFGSVGMEMIASMIFDRAGSEEMGVQQISHTISQSVEEFCEMIGIVIFIYALFDYLATHFSNVELSFQNSSRKT